MYITVKLLNGWQGRLTYKIPLGSPLEPKEGMIVTVPLQNRLELAIIETHFKELPSTPSYKIKELHGYDHALNEERYQVFVKNLSTYYVLDPRVLHQRLSSFLKQKEQQDHSLVDEKDEELLRPTLTQEQKTAVDAIIPAISDAQHQTFVLHGVTGSGKTIVYQELIEHTYALSKSVILMLPEVSLAVQFTNTLKKYFGTRLSIFSFHSATSATEKKDLWRAIRSNQQVLVIGVHLPMLIPLPNIGLIIVDEEHEIGYQEKKHPKINSKEAALMRAQAHTIPIVLGSATPSISSLYNIDSKKWKLLTLHHRYAGAFPKLSIVKLKSTVKRTSFWISKELESALRERLQKGEQSLIFINRRGYSFFIQCTACGFIATCSSCSVSLTLHEGNLLRCHYCTEQKETPLSCPSCSKKEFLKKGIGTQQIVSILQKLLPTARIARADLDTTVNRRTWQKTMEDFYNQKIDILVGTQTITKGYHFPNVTLVGIIWADMHLGLPSYNSAEITLQQLIQVAGRAGRYHPESTVIAQTMLDHPLWSYLNETRYLDFYSYEQEQRALLAYPPAARFAEIEMRHTDENKIEEEANKAADIMQTFIDSRKSTLRLLGPAQPPVHKIQNVHIRKLYLKGTSIKEIIEIYRHLKNHPFESKHYFTPNPLSMS